MHPNSWSELWTGTAARLSQEMRSRAILIRWWWLCWVAPERRQDGWVVVHVLSASVLGPVLGRMANSLTQETYHRDFSRVCYILQKFVSLLPCKLFTYFSIVFPAKSFPCELISNLDQSYRNSTKNLFFSHPHPPSQNPESYFLILMSFLSWILECFSYVKDTLQRHHSVTTRTRKCTGALVPLIHRSIQVCQMSQ